MGMLVFVLGSLKWALLCFVLVLGVGKAIARVASWVANNACQVWLRRRPVSFSVAGASYKLAACRLGVVEVDLFSGWLRSRGRLPCLGVVLASLDLRVEASSPEGHHGGDAAAAVRKPEARPTGPTPASASSPAASELKILLASLLWENLATWVLSQCGVTVFGIRVVLDCPGNSAGVADCRTGRGARGGGGGVSTELFVSCVEAFAKPLERGGGGTKLAVRIEQA
ncbi:unnamed protein product, partial [Ectocarpus sp. 12 AP-2014]